MIKLKNLFKKFKNSLYLKALIVVALVWLGYAFYSNLYEYILSGLLIVCFLFSMLWWGVDICIRGVLLVVELLRLKKGSFKGEKDYFLPPDDEAKA